MQAYGRILLCLAGVICPLGLAEQSDPLVSLLLAFDPTPKRLHSKPCNTRRILLQRAISIVVANPLLPTCADSVGGTVEKISTPVQARKQIAEGYEALSSLLDNFDSITSAEGGDGIRRVVGTVGVSSPVYLIDRAFRLLFEMDESLPMEYIENLEQLKLLLAEADTQAYSANFVSFSSAKGKPEDYYKRARKAIVQARDIWKTMMEILKM